MPNEPSVPESELAAHSAATDEALSAILGDLDDDPGLVGENGGDEADS